MKKVTVMGMYISKTDRIGTDDGGTSYGNLLNYPGVLSCRLLNENGFALHNETELPPEEADIVFCVDLTPELWNRIKALPSRVHKILQACESPIYAGLSHFAAGVLTSPVWDAVMTWNRSYEADYVVHYDIPVAGKSVSEPLAEQPEITEEYLSGHGVVISSFKQGDIRGMAPIRDALYRELAVKGWIDLYGKNWQCNPGKKIFGAVDNKLKILQKYPFALVIENIWAPGYVTEKLPDCILAGIPVIYWGDFPNAQRRFPNTFIPLEEVSVSGFLKARGQLAARYPDLRKNVLKCRGESDHWCDSYLNAIRKVFSRIVFSVSAQ